MVRRPQGAQLQEAIATATAAVASCIPSSTTRQVAAVAGCRIPLCVGFQEYHVRRLKSNLKKNVEL